MCSPYKNKYRNFKPVETAIRRETKEEGRKIKEMSQFRL
jgi:hypothetical protein